MFIELTFHSMLNWLTDVALVFTFEYSENSILLPLMNSTVYIDTFCHDFPILMDMEEG